MGRRIVLAAVIASLPIVAVLVAHGCTIYTGPPGEPFGSNCDPKIPYKCCQCPWPEDCPPYNPKPYTIPDWCAPYLIDAGCSERYTYDRSICEQNANDGGTDGGDGGMTSFCASGTCVPPAPEAWKHVAFVMSWPELPPACPEDAPNIAFEGSPAPPDRVCPACSCDEPEGTCSLPTTWTVSSANCDNPNNGVKTNFDPPSGWDGLCSDTNAIAQGKLCGGVPCVQSLTISLPIIEEKPCTSRTAGWVDMPIPKAWNDGPRMPIARACTSNKPLPNCSGHACVGTNSTFGACILHDGDQVCPEGWNGERHVLYEHVDDARECTPCGCDLPSGATCKVKWRAFSDSSCTIEVGALDISAGMMGPACYPLAPGVALVGKTAELLNYTKGTCTPMGGELVGDLKLDGQVTVCCASTTM